jgi:hypothetical protein
LKELHTSRAPLGLNKDMPTGCTSKPAEDLQNLSIGMNLAINVPSDSVCHIHWVAMCTGYGQASSSKEMDGFKSRKPMDGFTMVTQNALTLW